MRSGHIYCKSAMLVCTTMLLIACSSTALRSSWFPDGRKMEELNKVAVFVLSEDKEQARLAESIIAKELGTKAKPGHQILEPGDAGNKSRIEARLRTLGYDGAVSVRLLLVENKEKYVPPVVVQAPPTVVMPGYVPGMGFYGYYGHAIQQTQVIPGYTAKYTEVVVENIAYSLRSNEAVWVGITETRSPDSVSAAAGEIGAQIRSAMVKGGLL